MTVYPLPVVRTLALHSQGLTQDNRNTPEPDMHQILTCVEKLGAVQIDTLQMVQRSHFLVLWSRLGKYDPVDFERLAYNPQHRRLFEGWMHAACILPLSEYRFQLPHQRLAQEDGTSWFGNWSNQPDNRELLEMVRTRIRQHGAQRAQDFEYDGPKRGSWWDWKPAKIALEHLHVFGEVMIANRKNFQRVYDLTERVLPDWVDLAEPSLEMRNRHWVEKGVLALGICKPDQGGDYSYRKKTPTRTAVRDLLAEGILLPVQARLADGEIHELVVHRKNLMLLEQIADGVVRAERTTFLSPFDSLFWARQRDQQFWGFRQVLEAYVPASKRKWGYFCLAILHGERLVGRFDPKLERKAGLLRLKALYLEPETQVSDELVISTAQAMRDFMDFHHARELVIERSDPHEFGVRVMAALSFSSSGEN
jgi:uncharacterized protein